jgi:dihydroorotate dehydrogenase (NAD+) catalytic subunit
VTDKPLFVKMAPVNVAEIAKALEAAGADGLSVINSIQGMAIDVHTRKSRVAKPKGGLSGPLCHHIAVRMVWEVAQAVDIPINGVGGVMTGRRCGRVYPGWRHLRVGRHGQLRRSVRFAQDRARARGLG